ncbi:nuclear transport factor 2 family protein [Shewanella corallii]|uniref:Nuclear transport factor 2 family protein n=1 Tax=Shewanella corallii TaxID=560080 RepID=A0ABT0NAS2_9GAMM|nr:nuclear transport factor 2 family protein [Shewanella corallii]MCL2915514.1 nuclear transport factor 2 family protein [Shewanella corallii]
MKLVSIEKARNMLTIQSVVYQLARGVDRMDDALIRDCFWPDATDDHGLYRGSAMGFVDWVLPLLAQMQRTQHIIGNVLIDIAGTNAWCESYFQAYHQLEQSDGQSDMYAAGRYLDLFELRNHEWRIIHRQVVYDWNRNEASSSSWDVSPMKDMLQRGERATHDLSYQDLASNRKAILSEDI